MKTIGSLVFAAAILGACSVESQAPTDQLGMPDHQLSLVGELGERTAADVWVADSNPNEMRLILAAEGQRFEFNAWYQDENNAGYFARVADSSEWSAGTISPEGVTSSMGVGELSWSSADGNDDLYREVLAKSPNARLLRLMAAAPQAIHDSEPQHVHSEVGYTAIPCAVGGALLVMVAAKYHNHQQACMVEAGIETIFIVEVDGEEPSRTTECDKYSCNQCEGPCPMDC